MRKTPLYGFHQVNGHLAEYAGFEMPMWYRGAVEEHLAVRNACGVFDVSHMGRLIIMGKEAVNFLDCILTNSCIDLEPLVARQAFLCNSSGGIIDDIMVFRLEQERFLLIVNAINTRKDVKWMGKNVADFDVVIEDMTSEVPMITVQGPKALQILQTLSEADLSALRRLHAAWIPLSNRVVLVSRTGYTGEDGFEAYIFQGKEAGEVVRTLWDGILEAGKGLGIEPCGLVARDSLRLEAGLCLNGNELDEETTPIEAGLKYGVSLEGRRFVGKEALSRQLENGLDRVRVGLRMIGRGVPRKGMEIVADGKRVGFVTSGTFSPLLIIGIGMGYVPPEYSEAGTEIGVMIRRRVIKAEIVKLPFYDESRYGWRRKKK
jgi:aminomethyltransferase